MVCKTVYRLFIIGIFLFCSNVHAIGFGIFDPRTQAMGGASVASARAGDAFYYNPALISLESLYGREDKGRVYLPRTVAEVTQNTERAVDIISEQLDVRLAYAVYYFNKEPTLDRVQTILDEIGRIDDAVNDLEDERYWADSYFGLSLSETRDGGGESLFVGMRVVGGGGSTFSNEDLTALKAYRSLIQFFDPRQDPGMDPPMGDDGGSKLIIEVYLDTLDYIERNRESAESLDQLYADAREYFAANLDGGEELLELLNEDLALLDPNHLLTSTADISAMVITEWGSSFAHGFDFGPMKLSFGFTPKLMLVDVYEDNIIYGRQEFKFSGKKNSYYDVNADIGAALGLGEHFQLGFSVKDVIPTEYEKKGQYRIEMRPRARVGAALKTSWINLGIDVDTTKNQAISLEPSVQEVSTGVEFFPTSPVNVRFGYRHDLLGNREGIFSAGVGLQIVRLLVDVTYGQNANESVFGAQFGWTF